MTTQWLFANQQYIWTVSEKLNDTLILTSHHFLFKVFLIYIIKSYQVLLFLQQEDRAAQMCCSQYISSSNDLSHESPPEELLWHDCWLEVLEGYSFED